MIWRERRVLLVILGVLLLANAVFFFTYRVRFQGRVDSINDDLAQVEAQYEQARSARLKAEATFQSYRKVEGDVAQVFDQHWSTQAERFTALVAEVKRLAMASSLAPPSYGFSRTIASTGRRKAQVGAAEVGIAFQVAGTYQQVRRLINLLELSQQFVIIDQISLMAREGQTLTLTLRLKTLFRDEKTPDVANDRL
jgi:hypothetical protein